MKNAIKTFLFRIFKYISVALEHHQWQLDKKKFKSVGSNSRIMYPYTLFNPQYIVLGNNFSTLKNTRIEAFDSYYHDAKFNPAIVIGNNVSLNSDCHIGCVNKIIIGNNVLIASRVYISDHNHGNLDNRDINIPPYLRPLTSKGSVIIEDNVWIGEGVCILPGVTIGRNSIIGANSVVSKNIPSNTIAVGVPARVIKLLQ